jgi:hypothetical protein
MAVSWGFEGRHSHAWGTVTEPSRREVLRCRMGCFHMGRTMAVDNSV